MSIGPLGVALVLTCDCCLILGSIVIKGSGLTWPKPLAHCLMVVIKFKDKGLRSKSFEIRSSQLVGFYLQRKRAVKNQNVPSGKVDLAVAVASDVPVGLESFCLFSL